MCTLRTLLGHHSPVDHGLPLAPATTIVNNISNNKTRLLYLDGVFASPVPLDKTDNEADAEEEDDGEEHPDEPAGGGEGALLRLVASRYVQVRVHALQHQRVFNKDKSSRWLKFLTWTLLGV